MSGNSWSDVHVNEADAVLGIDLGGTDIKAVVLQGGQIVWRQNMPTRAAEGREAVMMRLVELVELANRHTAPSSICRMGLAVPAVLDFPTGRIELLPNFTPEWTGFLLGNELEGRTGLRSFLLNDVRAATLAEHIWGGGKGYRDFVSIAIGTGIGGGLVLNNHLYLGSRGAAGEIGHQTVVLDGPLCNCGNRGCLEGVASGAAIARAARAAIEAGEGDLDIFVDGEAPAPEQVASAAGRGSATGRAILDRAGEFIGLALGNLVCVLNPEAVVVGGGVARAGDLLLEPIRREIKRRTIVFSPERGGVDVIASPLAGMAGAMGAAAWAMRQ